MAGHGRILAFSTGALCIAIVAVTIVLQLKQWLLEQRCLKLMETGSLREGMEAATTLSRMGPRTVPLMLMELKKSCLAKECFKSSEGGQGSISYASVRAMSLCAAIEMTGKSAIPLLMGAMDDADPNYAYAAAACIQVIYRDRGWADQGFKSVAEMGPILRELLQDQNESLVIRDAAADTLKKIQWTRT